MIVSFYNIIIVKISLFYEEIEGEKKKIKRNIKCSPELPEWNQLLFSLPSIIYNNLNKVECFKTKAIGAARDSHYLRIFVTDDEFVKEYTELI